MQVKRLWLPAWRAPCPEPWFHDKDAGQTATGTNTTPAMSRALGLGLTDIVCAKKKR
jgi:hypothetical protein